MCHMVELNMNKISVIVPVYHCEKTIERCVDSIINQTYKNLEIILVDDGSADSSGAICDRYAQKDSRIRVLHKPNGGASSARNCGLEISSGDFIGFVDADDYIDTIMYEELIKAAMKQNAAAAVCGYRQIYQNERKEIAYRKKEEIITGQQLLSDIFQKKCMGVMWNKIFSRDLFFKNGNSLRFREDIHLCEDVLLLTQLFQDQTQIAISNCVSYNYAMMDESLSHGAFSESPKKQTVFLALNEIVHECYTNHTSLQTDVNDFFVTDTVPFFLALYKKKQEYSKIIKSIKHNLIKKLKNSSTKTKVKILLVVFCTRLYMKRQSLYSHQKVN